MIRVLILDDDPVFCESLSRSLRRTPDVPFEVETATTVDQARRAVEQAAPPFDVFLVDQRLGAGQDGIAVMQELRRQSPATEAIIITGNNEPEAGLRAYEAGAYRYLSKPFELLELILIVRSLQQLKVLTDVAEEAQRAMTVQSMADIIVRGGQKLGFERARLWLLDEGDGKTLIGASQLGNVGLPDFAGLRLPATGSPYTERLLIEREPIFFRGQERGQTYLHRHLGSAGYQPPVGDWVHIPLWSNERCQGGLSLDNASAPRPLTQDQRNLLRLYGRQAAAALERARLHEQDERSRRELAVLNQIGQRVTTSAATDDLDGLLRGVRAEVGKLLDVRNFMVVLVDRDEREHEVRLEFEHGRAKPPRQLPRGKGLTRHIIRENMALLLQGGSEQYRAEHGIRPHGIPSSCWLGAPLRLGKKAIGAIVVQSYDDGLAYTEDDQRLLAAVADQIAGAIQTARLKADEVENSRRLMALQRAGEALTQLAEESQDLFWHALLTVITADYALGFNRAALFLAEQGDRLRGQTGIGHFDRERARKSWEQDRRNKQTFEQYLAQLRGGELAPTPVEQEVRRWMLDISDDGAFRQVLHSGKLKIVRARQARQHLPGAFFAWFGAADYAVLPLRAGSRPLGLVVVDNAHNREPLRRQRLAMLERFLSQMALVIETVRQRRAREQLIEFNLAVMSEVSDLPLQVTLTRICQAVQTATAADCVMIYPLLPDAAPGTFIYDTANIGHVGLRNTFRPRIKPGPSGVTMHVLQSGETQVVSKIEQTRWYDPQRLSESSFLQREGIRAFIGTPIYDTSTGQPSGTLYLNYREPQEFGPMEIEQARSFAGIASVVIRSARQQQEVRRNLQDAESQSQARGKELDILRQVLQALTPGAAMPGAPAAEPGQKRVARALLQAARDLLDQEGARVGLLLRDWAVLDANDQEPSEVRRQYFMSQDGAMTESLEREYYRGISGRALQLGESLLVDDVREQPWSGLFYADQSQQTISELDVPIWLDQQIIGLLNLESPRLGAFAEAHKAMLERIAAAAALALDTVRRQEHLRNVLEAAHVVIEPSGLEETLSAVLDAARRAAIGVSALTIWYKAPESGQTRLGPQFGVHNVGGMQRDRPEEQSVVRRVMQLTAPVWAMEAQEHPLLNGRFVEEEGVRSTAAFPLRTSAEVVGALFFNYRQTHPFSSEEQVLFPLIAAIAAASIRDALRLDEVRKERDRLRAAITITEAVGTSLDLNETLGKIMETLRAQFPGASAGVLIYDHAERALAFAPASSAYYRSDRPDKIVLPLTGPSIVCQLARESLKTRQVVHRNIGDVVGEPSYLPAIGSTRSELGITLMSGDELLGVLVLEWPTPHAFSDDDIPLIQSVGQQISMAIERSYQSAKLRFNTTIATSTAWAAEIAHDIKNEIGTIRDRVDWLRDEPYLSDEGRESLEEIDLSAARLTEAAQAPRTTTRESLPLDGWLREKVAAIIEERGPDADVRVCLDELRCGDLCVRVSPLVLERVLRHLVRNALEAMQYAGTLTLRTRQKDTRYAEVQICDSGPGVAEEVRSRLFNDQVTTKRREGGLGLVIVRWSVEDMGGAIKLLPSEQGQGATFAFTLPVARPPSASSQ